MKQIRRCICILLVMSLLLANMLFVSAFAAEIGNQPVLLETFVTEHYEMAMYQEGDSFYVITLLSDGRIELAFAEEGETGRTIWLHRNDVAITQQDASNSTVLASSRYAKEIIQYGMERKEQSAPSKVTVHKETSLSSAQEAESNSVRGGNASDYNALMNQLAAIHGTQHDDYNWTNMISMTAGGLTYKFKEMLYYEMVFREKIEFGPNTTLGELALEVASRLPYVGPVISTIATVLDVVEAVDTILVHFGYIANYYGTVVRTRYVLINDRGPYYETDKLSYYSGWVEEGKPGSATLEHIDTVYTDTQAIFESYTQQRILAYENYS